MSAATRGETSAKIDALKQKLGEIEGPQHPSDAILGHVKEVHGKFNIAGGQVVNRVHYHHMHGTRHLLHREVVSVLESVQQ